MLKQDAITRIDVGIACELAAEGSLRGFFWISDEDYHHPQCPGISSTRLKQILRSPAHYKCGIENHEATEAMIFGRQVHEMLFQPDRFVELYTKAEPNPYDWNRERKHYIDWKVERQNELGDRIELSVQTWEQIYGIVNSVWEKKSAKQLLEGNLFELACFTVDEETGIILKVKLDVYGGWHITDLKTCQDARPESFYYDAKKYKYWLSAALYMDVVNREMSDHKVDCFIWIAAEKARPYGTWCHAATEHQLDEGRKQYRAALAILKDCQTTGNWACYPDEITPLEVIR